MPHDRYPVRIVTTRDPAALARRLAAAGVDPYGVEAIRRKAEIAIVRIDGVGAPAANVLKQQLLSLGGDAAVHRDAIRGAPERSTVYLVADRRRFDRLPEKLAGQPFGLAALGETVARLLAAADRPPLSVRIPGGELDLSARPLVMGILNVTPDSFSDGGAWLDPDRAAGRARAMVAEGAGIVDIGGESTRPGAAPVSPEEELARVRPVLERLAGTLPVPLSIDTRSSAVARAAIDLGAAIVNDVSGLRHDPAMAGVVARAGAAAVVMHMQGTPDTMQRDPRYEDVVSEVVDWLGRRTDELRAEGIDARSIIVDPGIGFGKRLEHNLALLAEIGDLRTLGFPILVGHSRKAFIGSLTGREPAERASGGFAALARCLAGGARIVRVHDVRETADFIAVWQAIERAGASG